MSMALGAVADDYDRLRPGYPASIADAVRAAVGDVPETPDGSYPRALVEIGAGTGKATTVFRRLGPLTCVEPDTRMAARLRRRFPDVEVVAASLETWRPPSHGVPLIAGALVWHLLSAGRRCRLVHEALAPGGHVVLVGRRNALVDPRQAAVLRPVFHRFGWADDSRPLTWIGTDLAQSGLFAHVATSRHDTVHTIGGADYLRLVGTYSKFLALDGTRRQQLRASLADAVAATGGVVRERLQTTVHVARRR